MQVGDLQKPLLLSPASSAETRLDGVRRAAERGDARETAHQFEELFAVMLVRELRRAMPEGPFGQGPGAHDYEGWFDEHLGGALAERDALGIAGMVKSALGRAQAAQEGAPGSVSHTMEQGS